MWLGMDLKAIADENPGALANPYPGSKDPAVKTIEPTAEGLTFGAKPAGVCIHGQPLGLVCEECRAWLQRAEPQNPRRG